MSGRRKNRSETPRRNQLRDRAEERLDAKKTESAEVAADADVRALAHVAGEAKSWRMTVNDVSDRHQAADALREREEIYSAIVNQAADGIVLIDPKTLRFVEFNDAACRGMGYTREEFAALRLTDIQAALTSEQVSERLLASLRSGEGTFRKPASLQGWRDSRPPDQVSGREDSRPRSDCRHLDGHHRAQGPRTGT